MLDISRHTTVYNDNQACACVNWLASVTNKGVKHINLHENQVRESHQAKVVRVKHNPGVINPSDIFTKEMQDAAHFRRLCDSMMCSKSVFLRYGHTVPTHITTAERILPYYSLSSPHEVSRPHNVLQPSIVSPSPSRPRNRHKSVTWAVSVSCVTASVGPSHDGPVTCPRVRGVLSRTRGLLGEAFS